MRLLLDLGNTRLKWAMQTGDSCNFTGALAWSDEFPAALADAWQALPVPQAIVAASVTDAARETMLLGCARDRFGLDISWLRTPAAACGVINAYPEPQRLGVDRFLGMVAAHADGLGACVLAGVGTALTLDALAADGRHLGGLIAPGPQLMQQSLLGATARVRPDHAGRLVDAADNTADAVRSGCWQAAAALVERFVATMAPRLGGHAVLSLSGGDARQLAALLTLPARHSEHSVLRGLAVWARAHCR
jgi:type III pantothenate kinase